MATTTVGPGEFLKAAAAAADGDTLDVVGLQDLAGRYRNSKHLILTRGKGPRPILQGATTDAGGLMIDGGEDPFNGFLLDDNTPLDDVGRPSWIANWKSPLEWRGVELTNRHSKIGFQPSDYGGVPAGSGFRLKFAYIHGIGGVYKTKAEAGAEAVQRKDGLWVGNHSHGYYASGNVGGLLVEDTLIEDCSDRGMQARAGVHDAIFRRILIRACGEGFDFGDPCSNVSLEDFILLDNLCASRGLLEEWRTGTGNKATNGVVFNRDGRKGIMVPSVKLTNVRELDPLYDPATRKLAANSPALGLGPSFIQPGATPTPTPTPAPDVATAIVRVADVIYDIEHESDWPTYRNAPASFHYKAHANALAVRKALTGS